MINDFFFLSAGKQNFIGDAQINGRDLWVPFVYICYGENSFDCFFEWNNHQKLSIQKHIKYMWNHTYVWHFLFVSFEIGSLVAKWKNLNVL